MAEMSPHGGDTEFYRQAFEQRDRVLARHTFPQPTWIAWLKCFWMGHDDLLILQLKVTDTYKCLNCGRERRKFYVSF